MKILVTRTAGFIDNQDFNYGEYATIASKSGLNNYKLRLKDIEQEQIGWDIKRNLTKLKK